MNRFLSHSLSILVMALSLTTASSVLADAQPPVLYLAAPGQFPDERPVPLLVRELARQAFLIAARDEMGLYTRDGVCREWSSDPNGPLPADAQGKPALLMDLHMQAGKGPWQVKVDLSTLGANPTSVDSDTIATPREVGQWVSVTQSLENIEPLSRTAYPQLLKKLGYTPQIQPHGDKDIPDGVDHLLYQTTLLSPFSALQQVHAAIRQSGESPARLSALVRGYANLGLLTRFQWASIHKVMTARSLLYAQRMVNEDPDSPFALYNRAYAYAMTGLHAAALADLEQARQHEDELSNAGKPVPPIPKWVALLDPFCKYDVQHLVEIAPQPDPRAPLASLLVFAAVENCKSLSELMGVGNAALMVDGNCFAIMDGMMLNAGVASGHELTERAPQAMLDTLPDDIKLLTVVPKPVQKALAAAHGNPDHVANLTSVSSAFIGAPELAEPSFTLAGRIVQETNFVHAMRRAVFMADYWGVPCGEYVDSIKPLIADHPYKAYVESLKLPYARRGNAMRSMQLIDPQWQMYTMLGHLAPQPITKGKMIGPQGWRRIHGNLVDATAADAERMLNPSWNGDTQNLRAYAPCVLQISPYSAIAAGTIIEYDYKSAEPHLDEWTARFANQPAFQLALASHWLNVHDLDKAETPLKQLVQYAPDREYVEMLARLYLNRGDEDKWLTTMKIVLTQPDYRLDHSMVESEIAWHYMSAGKFDVARGFADACYNDSGSAWSMECDAYAAEFQGDFATAEKLIKEEEDRYNSPLTWYRWCERTGHGDRAAAKKSAEDRLTAAEQGNASMNSFDAANVSYLDHNLDKAEKYYDQYMRDQHVCLAAVQLALVRIEKKDNDGRDAAFLFATQHCRKDLAGTDRSCYADYAKAALAANGSVPTEEQVDAILKTDHGNDLDRTGLYYFRGKQLQLSGDVEGAKKAYKTALELPSVTASSYLFAADAMRQLGETCPPLPRPPEGGYPR